MYYPDRKEFRRRAESSNLQSVYREILADMETPVSAFRRISENGGAAFLLESVEGGERLARYSFLGSNPHTIMQSIGRRVELIRDGCTEVIELKPGEDPLHTLEAEMSGIKWWPDPNLPRFCGGAVGYLGYDLVRFFEDLPNVPEDDTGLPDCMLAFADTLLIFDHVQHKILALANVRTDGNVDAAYDEAIEKIDRLVQSIKRPTSTKTATNSLPKSDVQSNFATREDFEQAVTKCKDYVAAGDIVQVVVSQRFSTTVAADPFDIYRALRSVNPSPYMYYLSFGDTKLIGSSPEILVTVRRGEVTTRPIAGTRRRGKTPEEDRLLESELLADTKEQAEHMMLVDLGKDDLGKVCDAETVRVDELMTVERYSHVMHIVSNVRGALKDGLNQFDVLRATFPAGTVSGAPKPRAMEIIDELEPTKRGPYAGAIGYFGYSGDMDACITIRTIIIHNSTGYVQAGAGIIAESVPANEYQETVNKSSAMLRALEMAEAGLE